MERRNGYFLLLTGAAVGLAISLVVHLGSFFGLSIPLLLAAPLHIGAIAIGAAACRSSPELRRIARDEDFWAIALRGCPYWMKRLTFAFFIYAVANFLVFWLQAVFRLPHLAPDSALMARGFSGHWMLFYSMAFSIAYSQIHSSE